MGMAKAEFRAANSICQMRFPTIIGAELQVFDRTAETIYQSNTDQNMCEQVNVTIFFMYQGSISFYFLRREVI
jgi:argonaute-like protein implicated in RNA metabolism and viral defense